MTEQEHDALDEIIRRLTRIEARIERIETRVDAIPVLLPSREIERLHRDNDQLRGYLEIERRVSAELRAEIERLARSP